jgi:hypothetical protein
MSRQCHARFLLRTRVLDERSVWLQRCVPTKYCKDGISIIIIRIMAIYIY